MKTEQKQAEQLLQRVRNHLETLESPAKKKRISQCIPAVERELAKIQKLSAGKPADWEQDRYDDQVEFDLVELKGAMDALRMTAARYGMPDDEINKNRRLMGLEPFTTVSEAPEAPVEEKKTAAVPSLKSRIFTAAWATAKAAAAKFGGSSRQYFSMALKQAWAARNK